VELRQLRYFLTVAEEQRFARAAERLHIAAPSLSQQIHTLERELRVTLFVRTPQRVGLTPAGEALVRRARVILAEVDRAREEVRAAGAGRREQLSLRVANMAELVLDGPLRVAALGIPGVEVSASSSQGDDAIEAVRQARADAAVVWARSLEQRDLEGVVLGSVDFGVALQQGHALTDLAVVPVARLAGETVIMFPRAPFAGVWDRALDHLLPNGPVTGQFLVEPDLVDAPEAMLRSVATGGGVAPVILGIAAGLGVPGIEVRPLEPALCLELEVVWRAPAGAAVQSLVDFLMDAARDPQAMIEAPRSDSASPPLPPQVGPPHVPPGAGPDEPGGLARAGGRASGRRPPVF
jgi:DNA-binding transcriptional LysR family regulator